MSYRPSFFFLVLHRYLHISLSLTSMDLRIFPFSDIKNPLTLIAFSETLTFADIITIFTFT